MKILFSTNVPLREQLAPFLQPAPCPRHPEVVRAIDDNCSLEATLHPWGESYNAGRQRFDAVFFAEYASCAECETASCFRLPDGCARLYTTSSKTVPVTADLVVEQAFRDWCKGLVTAVCERNGQRREIPCLSTKFTLSRPELDVCCIYDDCIQCLLEKVGVPRLFSGCQFDNYVCENPNQSKVLQDCRDFGSSFKGFLTLIGNNGTGKTHLAVAVLRAFLRSQKRATVRYVEFATLIAELRRSYGRKHNDDEESDPIALACKLDCLVLDEVRLSGGADEEQALFSLVNHRMNNFLPTVFITNLPEGEIRKSLGSRTVDRLNQVSFQSLSFNWSSYRHTAKANYLERAALLQRFPPA